MKKKILSLALALALCLGLTVPAFAAETYTDTYEGVTITAQPNGSVSYTGAGELTWMHAEVGGHAFLVATDDVQSARTISISIGQGLTVTDEFKENWSTLAYLFGGFIGSIEGLPLSYSDSTTPAQPEQPQQPAVDNWAKERVNAAVEAGLVPDGLGDDYRVNITRAQFAAVAVRLYEVMGEKKAPEVTKSPFSDTSDPAVLQAAELGFVSGVGDGKFGPDSLVTREQMAVMLAKVYTELGGKMPNVTVTAFADDKAISSWAKTAVDFMNGKKILSGKGDRKFVPNGEGGSAKIEEAVLVSLKMLETLK